MTAEYANACLKDVLEHGIVMEVFAWEDVEQNMDLFMKLMASDNFDSEMSMGEDEFSCTTPSLRTFKHALQKIEWVGFRTLRISWITEHTIVKSRQNRGKVI